MGLIRLVKSNNVEGVRKYIDSHDDMKAVINSKDDTGETALIRASTDGHTEIVKMLLGVEGIDVNIQNKNGYNAFMNASRYGKALIIKLI